MSEPKKPADRAKETVNKGVSELFRAATSVAEAVRQQTGKAAGSVKAGGSGSNKSGLGKAIDDAGREVVRAASNVATRVGGGLQHFGKKAQQMVDGEPVREGEGARASGGAAGGPGDEDWPKSREEYERKYGRDGDDWPKSREEYIERYGRPPRKRGDDDDPGFRIAMPK